MNLKNNSKRDLEKMLLELTESIVKISKETMNCGICGTEPGHDNDCPVLIANKSMKLLGLEWSKDLESLIEKNGED